MVIQHAQQEQYRYLQNQVASLMLLLRLSSRDQIDTTLSKFGDAKIMVNWDLIAVAVVVAVAGVAVAGVAIVVSVLASTVAAVAVAAVAVAVAAIAAVAVAVAAIAVAAAAVVVADYLSNRKEDRKSVV